MAAGPAKSHLPRWWTITDGMRNVGQNPDANHVTGVYVYLVFIGVEFLVKFGAYMYADRVVYFTLNNFFLFGFSKTNYLMIH